jgi:uncharacterized repeat protein (TIGR01451 family)
VVAGFDTGVTYTHPALMDKYRGKRGDTFNHNYSWFEPDSKLYPDGNLGPSVSDAPRDCDTHGTHTMGTMVGSSPPGATVTANVGMAPNARWIAVPGICDNTMPGDYGDDIGGLKAFQWLLCPTDLSGDLATADCSKAPDAVNNSWGSANPVDNVFRPALQALRAAGIAPVFAAGNPSAGPGSIGAPANNPEAISVGATDRADSIASFSARGPSFYEGEQKPELSAPGVDVRSTIFGSDYGSASGTSMAAPHVAGLVALMVSADLQDGVRDFNVDELERIMASTAVDLGEPGPDDDYGHGRINAYEAVNTVLNAGDLRGRVTDANTGELISNLRVTGIASGSQSRFTGQQATGAYSLTVPAGGYDVRIEAWGYESATFRSQTVFPETLSVADFALAPLPRHTVSGYVRTGESAGAGFENLPASGAPVSGARVYVTANPSVGATTDGNGFYALDLPVGAHELAVEVRQHRVVTATVTVDSAAVALDLAPDAAPSILLVHADAYGGWFMGWPIHPLFEYALQKSGYLSDLWRIEDPDVIDTTTENGYTLHGIPSLETLLDYDVVIWVHSGCGYYCYQGAPGPLGADETLIEYLNSGGRLILSGQDIGIFDDGASALYDDYLQADLLSDFAAFEGDTLTGQGFLADLDLEITNASLYGYANGTISLSPDAVDHTDGIRESFPVLTYDNGAGAGALAVDPCTGDYRALYLPVGYENLGPRADNRDPDFPAIMERSLRWLSGRRSAQGLELIVDSAQPTGAPGRSILHHVDVVNVGVQPITAQLDLGEGAWAARIYSGTLTANSGSIPADLPELTGQTISLGPCQARAVTVVVDVPEEAQNGATDALALTATIEPDDTTRAEIVSVAFARWQVQQSMPTMRNRLGVVAIPDDIHVYAVGGWERIVSPDGYYYYSEPSARNDRYDPCTQRWEPAAPLPEARTNLAAAELDGKIYVVGGTDYDYWPRDSVFVYDPAADAWTAVQPLPLPVQGAAAASAHGKLYVFGGSDSWNHMDNIYEYDPATNVWTEKAPMPSGGRSYMAAATLDGKIYVVGGWPRLTRVEVYEPSTDSWTTAAPMNIGRHSPGLAAGPDGYLYLAGGGQDWLGTGATERYNPATDTWEMIPSLNDTNRAGTGAAYAAGQLFVVGGESSTRSTESLRLGTSFCLSDKRVNTTATQPGGRLEYTVRLFPEERQSVTARVRDTLPANTIFSGFTDNPAGAVYSSEANRIDWAGTLAAGTGPLHYSYRVDLVDQEWTSGTPITSTAVFRGTPENAPATRFTRSTVSRVFQPDFSASRMEADRAAAVRTERLRYTVRLESRTVGGGAVSLYDPLPAGLTYVPDSLEYPNGTAAYDPANNAIRWTGQVAAAENAFINDTGEYAWGDSNGELSLPGNDTVIPFEWIDIADTGEFVTSGDDVYRCGLPIGFPFNYYGVNETTFCVSTNGFIAFDAAGYSSPFNECLPSPYANRGTIAALWADLVVNGGVHYQTFGVAPERFLVVQWTNARFYYTFSSQSSTFQLILHEDGRIKVQMLDMDTETGGYFTTGVGDQTNTRGINYACNLPSAMQNELAVLFVPPGSTLGGANADVSFAVRVGEETPVNSEITNTVYITTSQASYQRSVTSRLNPVSLAASNIQIEQEQVNVGERVDLRLVLHNTGLLTATNASLVHPIGEEFTYLPDSMTCSSGACTREGDQIRWRGVVPAQGRVVVRYAATLTAPLPDRTLVTTTAQLNDGYGNQYELQQEFISRSSDLNATIARLAPPFVEPGGRATFEIFIHNVGAVDTVSTLALPLPAGLLYEAGSLVCGTGACTHEQGEIRWEGAVAARSAVPVRFAVTVPPDAAYGQTYGLDASFTDGNRSETHVRAATLTVAHNRHFAILLIPSQGVELYLPLAPRE